MSYSFPVVALEHADPTQIITDMTLSTTYQASSIISVEQHREITLLVDLNPGAVGDQISILPLLTASRSDVLVTTDDAWWLATVNDGTVTAAALSGTGMTGADFTTAPNFGRVTQIPVEVVTDPVDAGTNELRLAITIQCAWARKFHCQVAALSGTPVLNMHAVRSA